MQHYKRERIHIACPEETTTEVSWRLTEDGSAFDVDLDTPNHQEIRLQDLDEAGLVRHESAVKKECCTNTYGGDRT